MLEAELRKQQLAQGKILYSCDNNNEVVIDTGAQVATHAIKNIFPPMND